MDDEEWAQALRADVQETYDYLLSEAGKALSLGGSFAPFGAGVRTDGERTLMQADLAVEGNTPEEHIAALMSTFFEEAEAKRLRLGALAFDGETVNAEGERTAALVIHIEHVGGEGVQIFLPYSRGDELVFDRPILQAIEPEIFTAERR